MATLSQEAFPNTWRVLGLSVAASYAGLGTLPLIMPITMAREFGLLPKASPDAETFATRAMAWIGVRDLSVAAALFTFYYQEKPREMGTVILSGMILCAGDCLLVYSRRQDFLAYGLVAGASVWGWIGWNLTQL